MHGAVDAINFTTSGIGTSAVASERPVSVNAAMAGITTLLVDAPEGAARGRACVCVCTRGQLCVYMDIYLARGRTTPGYTTPNTRQAPTSPAPLTACPR